MNRARAALIAAGAVLVLRLTLAYGVSLSWSSPEAAPAVRFGWLCASQAALFGLPALVLRPWRSSVIPRRKRMLPAALLGWGAALALPALLALLTPPAPQGIPLPQSRLGLALMICATVLLPALCEEAFFRGGLLCALARPWGRKRAFLAVTALFALLHLQPQRLVWDLGVGALLTLAMLYSGRLWLPVSMHLLINAAALAGLPPAWQTGAGAALMLSGAALQALERRRKPI